VGERVVEVVLPIVELGSRLSKIQSRE
jgi:hypothetical protein